MMDLVALGHYPRPRSIVDFKLDALEQSKFIVVIVRNKNNDDDRYRSQQIDTAYQHNQDDSAVMRQQYDYIYLKGSRKNCRNKRCRRWWYCRRLVGNNKNNEDSSLPHREANSNSFFGHGFPPCKRILWIQKILRLWLIRISQKILSAGQTKILI